MNGWMPPPRRETQILEAFFKALAAHYALRAVRAVGDKASQGDAEAAALLLELVRHNANLLAPGCWEDPPLILPKKTGKIEGKGFYTSRRFKGP